MFLKMDGHACWRVQKALDEAGIEYEVVKEPALPRGRRKEVLRLTGQSLVPVIEFEDGTALREDSKDLAARIREGRLFEGRDGARMPEGGQAPAPEQPPGPQPPAQ
jgi:glutaredoxin